MRKNRNTLKPEFLKLKHYVSYDKRPVSLNFATHRLIASSIKGSEWQKQSRQRDTFHGRKAIISNPQSLSWKSTESLSELRRMNGTLIRKGFMNHNLYQEFIEVLKIDFIAARASFAARTMT